MRSTASSNEYSLVIVSDNSYTIIYRNQQKFHTQMRKTSILSLKHHQWSSIASVVKNDTTHLLLFRQHCFDDVLFVEVTLQKTAIDEN